MEPKTHRGRLSFSVGETLLTAWEAAHLTRGDVVLTTREAGYPGFLLFNNLPVALGEVVTLDGVLGVRVVDSDFRPPFQVDPGRIDEVGERVPAVVELGAVDVAFEDLRGLGRDSLVNFGCPWGKGEDATLVWGGFPVARGKVVVVGEQMGLRVTEQTAPPLGYDTVRQSGNVADRVSASLAKDYRFDMPDRWSWTQIRRLADLHRLFQRNLEASLPAVADLLGGSTEALLVDQCTLGEARAELGRTGLGEFRTWDHGTLRGDPGRRPRTLVLELPGCPHPLSAATRRSWEDQFTDRGLLGPSPVFLHTRSGWTDQDLGVLTGCLRYGWKRLVDFRLDPSVPPVEVPPRPLGDHEMVILVLLRPSAGGVPVLGLVYPYRTLEPYMNVLGS